MNETNCSKFKKRAAAVAVASCLTIVPFAAGAAGLGKLTVMSGLGQPLRAELDIAANRDELVGMTAKLAPQDAFRQAGIDYASALLDLRFAVEKKANGQSVVKVTSSRPVNEPFLDFLVELNWPTGRLVREYTFLLDPPEVAAKLAARPVVDAKIVETVQGGGVPQERVAPAPAKATPRPASAPKVASEPAKKNGEATRLVQPGDTLRKIAGETQHEGVSLEQMLVGLFRKNPDAFVASNINRLKAGAILDIPEKEAVEAVTPAEAKKVYVAQAADWNAYRQKLAATTAQAPVREEAGGQASSGKITAKLEEKAAPAEQSKDKVKVSPTETAKGAASAKAAADAEAERVAKDKSLKEAQDRLAILEKNVAELQKLVEMKNQKLAELQQQTAAKKEEAKPVEPPKPVEAPKPPEPVKAAEPPPPPKVAEEPKPVEPPKPVEEPPKPVEPPPPPVPVQPTAPTPKPVAPPPPPPEEPGLLDGLLEDPLPLAGGAAALALLGGYFVVRRRRASSGASQMTTTAPGPSSLGPNSVFRMTGGQSVDTGNTPPQTGDFSQTGPGTIDTDEVDPVAEADVYMAYGRDTQAEEILLEALQKDPHRTAIHAKLLEIYANRRSLKQFETLASELYAQTAGVGADWEKVAALGASLDPQNPLYTGAGKKAEAAEFDANATMVARPEDIGKSTLTMPAGALAQMAEMGGAAASEPEPAVQTIAEVAFDNDTLVLPEKGAEPSMQEPVALAVEAEPELDSSADLTSLDFDLGAEVAGDEAAPAPVAEEKAAPADELPADLGDALDFDLGGDTIVQAEPVDVLKVEDAPDLSFDLDVPAQDTAVNAPDVDEFADSGRDFSPEGTLVMPSSADVGISTFVGGEEPPESSAPAARDEEAVDFDFELDSAATATSINTVSEDGEGLATMVVAHSFDQMADHDDPKLVDTLVDTQVNTSALDADSLEFDVSLTDSVFLGQPMPTDFDIGSINLDLATPPTADAPVAETSATDVAASPEAAPPAGESPARDAHWEEVNTKLDLAKAYEEMGDLEGARELLQEVVGEGSVDLVEQAKTILGRIGE